MKTINTLCIKHPWLVVLAFLALTLLLGMGIGKLEVRNSFDGELPAQDPVNIDIEEVKARFGERNLIMIGIEADNLYTRDGLEAIRLLTEEMEAVPSVLVDEIKSLATEKNLNNREWGIESTGFLDKIPQSHTAWEALKNDIAANQMVSGKLMSKDGTFAVVAAPLDDDFEGAAVYTALKEIRNNYTGDEKLHMSGAPILVEDVQQGISADSRKFIAIAIVLIFFGFYLCFRSLSGVLLPLTMVIMSIIWTMGAMGYLSLNITVVSNALPVIMIAVASSYGIHYMNAMFSLIGKYETKTELISATIDKVGLPILITGITSSLGSLSLLVFKIQSLKEFGIIGSIGFFFATLICLLFLPALSKLIRLPKSGRIKRLNVKPFTRSLTTLVLNNRIAVLGAYLLLIPFFIWQAGKIQIGDDYIKFFPEKHEGRIAAETFTEKLNGIRVMDIMVDSKQANGIKGQAFYQQIELLESEIQKINHVGTTTSYTSLIDHIAKQFNSTAEEEIAEEEIAQYLMIHEMSATPGEISMFYDEEYQSARIQTILSTSNPAAHKEIYQRIKHLGRDIFDSDTSLSFGGDVMHRIALGDYIVKGKIQNILLALFIVFMTTLLLFRNLRKGLLTLLPIILSLIMVFGCMGLVGIRLGISTSLLTAMIVGIGIDFAIHYLVGYYNSYKNGNIEAIQHTSNTTGTAISYDALSNIIGFSVLSFSGFLPVQHFGWLLAFSMLLIFINTMVIYPLTFGYTPNEQFTNKTIKKLIIKTS